MPKFVIERRLPGAAKLTPDELRTIAQRSNAVLRDLGPEIQWVHSYVTQDKLYCIYNARDADLIREHARCGEFPIDDVAEVAGLIDPVSADG